MIILFIYILYFYQLKKLFQIQIYNSNEFNRRLDSMVERFDPEMQWDFSFERPYSPEESRLPPYNYQDFRDSIEKQCYGILWGLKEFVAERSNAVIEEFNIKLDNKK